MSCHFSCYVIHSFIHSFIHSCLEGVTKVDTDLKRMFVSVKVTTSNDKVLCVYTPLGHNTREQLAREDFSKGLQKYMENKSERNENKINCLMGKMDRDDRNKTQRLCRCGFNYALSKLIVNNGLGNL